MKRPVNWFKRALVNKLVVFFIPNNKTKKLMDNKHFLSQKQKEMLRASQSGGKVIVKPRKTGSGGFLGTLLTIEAITKY